tara:strand:+ start:1352 stop:1594 length:243 start_codon:yes stop_codon:yes gene_type:complete
LLKKNNFLSTSFFIYNLKLIVFNIKGSSFFEKKSIHKKKKIIYIENNNIINRKGLATIIILLKNKYINTPKTKNNNKTLT